MSPPARPGALRWRPRYNMGTRPTKEAPPCAGRYIEVVAALAPDYWLALPDEVPTQTSHRRAALSVQRSLAWLDRCLAAQVGKR